MPRHTPSFKTNLIAPSDGQSSLMFAQTTDNLDDYQDAPQIRQAPQVINEVD